MSRSQTAPDTNPIAGLLERAILKALDAAKEPVKLKDLAAQIRRLPLERPSVLLISSHALKTDEQQRQRPPRRAALPDDAVKCERVPRHRTPLESPQRTLVLAQLGF